MELVYRAAGSSDLDEICALVSSAVAAMERQGIFQWNEWYPTRADFQEDMEGQHLFVGLAEGRIAVVYAVNQDCEEAYQTGDWKDETGPFAVIHRLCVHPAFQNRGMAQSVLRHIGEELKRRGVRSIRLDVFSGNPAALRLYEKGGFSKVGCAHWRKKLFYLMERVLS